MKTKKAQFYIIAAIVIVIALLSLAAITNYVQVKKTPQKFYDLADILKTESKYVTENAIYTNKDVNSNIESYLFLFAKYLEENTQEDFNLIIFYGNIESNNVTGKIFSRASLGGVNLYLGSDSFSVQGGTDVKMDSTKVQVNGINPNLKTVNVTISSKGLNITQTLPVLEDNNFLFVMTSNQDFNQYIQNSLTPTTNI